jgi:ribosomal-protein-alanine N-acetyltransferase
MAAETKREKQGVAIRALRKEDTAAVRKILQEAPEAANWPEESFVESLSWRGAVALIAESDGKVTGFIIGRQVADEAEILNLAVTPAKRRRGEAEALLNAAMEEFRSRGVSRVFLEVRESNVTAITFYTKQGFAKTGRRDGYYRGPDEAAVVMEKKLTD